MILKELIDESSFNDVWKAFSEIYPDYSQHSAKYSNVYNELLGLTPAKNYDDMTIDIELIKEDSGHIEYHVHGRNTGSEWNGNWDLSCSTWESWLGYYVSEDVLRGFNTYVIISLCLWEMTWHGFNQQQIKEKISDMEQEFEDLQKWNDYERHILDGTIKINDQVIDYLLKEYKETQSSNIESLVIHLLKADYFDTEHIDRIQKNFNNKEINRQAYASLVRLKIDCKEMIDEKIIRILLENKLFSTIDYALDMNAITYKALEVFKMPNQGESFRKIKENIFLQAQNLMDNKGVNKSSRE